MKRNRLVGKNLDYYETANQQKTDIIYENCVSCENIGRAVTRLYLNIKKKSENQPVSNNRTREHTAEQLTPRRSRGGAEKQLSPCRISGTNEGQIVYTA